MPWADASSIEAAPEHPSPAEHPAAYGTLLVSGWAVFLLHLGLAGFAAYNAYDLLTNGFLASFGAIVRNGAYVLGYIGTGLCLLYLVLSIQRFDRLFARLAPGPVAPASRTSWLCTVPLLAAGGTLLVVTLLRAFDPELPAHSWSFPNIVLAGYFVLAGLSAEAVARLLKRAEAAGARLAGAPANAGQRSDRMLLVTVLGSACLRFGGMVFFLYFLLKRGDANPGFESFLIADHAYRMIYVAAGTVAFAVLARAWGRALAAWLRAAKGSGASAPATLSGGGHPYLVAAFGAAIFLCGAVDAYRFGAAFYAPMAQFLVEAYVILPWVVMRLDARRIRAAAEVLAANAPAAAPSSRRSVVWVSRLVVFAVVLAIFGQAFTDAILDGAAAGSGWMVWRYFSVSLVWRSFLHRELFWFLCVGSLTVEAVAFEDALERLAAGTFNTGAESAS